MKKLRKLWPEIDPYATRFVRVSEHHNIYVEESGNPNGIPVLVLHGGPGGGSEPFMRRFFNPAKYRIIIFDQRGSGKSTPAGSLVENTTWHLVRDIEKLRILLGIERWVVFGGSWGSTLALVYAECNPHRVSALIVRGIFLGERFEIDWFYRYGGIAQFFPDEWERYRAHIPKEEQDDLIEAYWRRLLSDDQSIAHAAAREWSLFEGSMSSLRPSGQMVEEFSNLSLAVPLARIECYYFRHNCFFNRDGWIMDHASRLRGIPGTIIHGRYDVVCQPLSAWRLKQVWRDAELVFTIAGHASTDPENTHELVLAAERFTNSK